MVKWRYADFGYSTIEVTGEALTMRFFADVDDYAAGAAPNREMYNFSISRQMRTSSSSNHRERSAATLRS